MVSPGLVQIDENESRAYLHDSDVPKLGFTGNGEKKRKHAESRYVVCGVCSVMEKKEIPVLSGAQ